MVKTPAHSAFLHRRGALSNPLYLHGRLLDPLQQAHAFLVLGIPDLDTALQAGSHEGRVEGENQLPHAVGYISFDATKEAVSFLGGKCPLLAYLHKRLRGRT